MTKHVIKKDQADTVEVSQSNSSWVIEKGVTLSGDVAFLEQDFRDVSITLAGKVAPAANGIVSIGPDANWMTDNTSINITPSGRIDAGNMGIWVETGIASFKNAGVVEAVSTAIYLEGMDLKIANSGEVTSETNAAIGSEYAETFLIRNDGLLQSDNGGAVVLWQGHGKLMNGADGIINGAVSLTGSTGNTTVVNRGQITDDGIAVALGTGDDRLVNRGKIDGEINLGNGNDLADLRKGTLANAVVHGEDGNDTFIVDNASIQISEFDGGGKDTIKTTVSFILGVNSDDYIETLTAIGDKDIDITGNFRDNTLNGNSADNELNGGGGIDHLSGFRGNDTLVGASGDDHFHFKAKTGIDTIVDFTLGEDKIHISKIDGILNIDDLLGHLIAKDFNGDGVQDTVINLGGGDSIRLIGIDKAMLSADDFDISM